MTIKYHLGLETASAMAVGSSEATTCNQPLGQARPPKELLAQMRDLMRVPRCALWTERA
jgi:hypothetical protein